MARLVDPSQTSLLADFSIVIPTYPNSLVNHDCSSEPSGWDPARIIGPADDCACGLGVFAYLGG